MGYGLSIPRGLLPVYSVGSEAEAHALVVMTCKMTNGQKYLAPELAEAQTVENLEKFSDRLDQAHGLIVEGGRCTCKIGGSHDNSN